MATPAIKENMVKINLYIPKSFKEWLEAESIQTGLTQTSLIHMALKTYIDQQRSMEMLPKMMEVLSQLKDKDVNPEEMKVILENLSKVMED